jgi:Mn2+/Fe2+ NRAMP family transporter
MGAALLVSLMAADALKIAAVVGVGSGMTLLHAGLTWLGARVGGVVVTGLVILGSFDRIARVFTLRCMALLVAVAVAVPTRPLGGQLLHRLLVAHLPLNASYLALLVVVLGAGISAYLFSSQAVHRIEDLRNEPICGRKAVPFDKRLPGQVWRELRAVRLDFVVGMLCSNLVVCAIVVAAVSTLRPHGHHDLDGVADAVKALESAVGRWAGVLFAFGFIGLGMLAIPVLVGFGLEGLLGKRSGSSRLHRQAPIVYGTVAPGRHRWHRSHPHPCRPRPVPRDRGRLSTASPPHRSSCW